MSTRVDVAADERLPDADWCRSFRRRILRWYEKHARDLPWRGTEDCYAIWVSEIMLQQTQVATVVNYYERFLAAFPTVTALAAADEEEVLRCWEGLGYYRRARQMHAAARQIVDQHDGVFPTEFEQVLALPGIGRYTAGAILSFGCGQRQPIVEANTLRLYSRLLGFDQDPYNAVGQRLLWEFAERILPQSSVARFNQALMELGSLVCAHPRPNCLECPVADNCCGFQQGIQNDVPLPKRKTQYEEVTEVAVVIRRADKVLVRQCGPTERWAGLWDFPRFAVEHQDGGKLAKEIQTKTMQLTGLTIDDVEPLLTIKHGVTKYRITLLCHAAVWRNGRESQGRWVAPADLSEVPLNVTARRLGDSLGS